MFSDSQFKILIRNMIAILILVSIILIGMLEFKNLFIEPSVLVLQSKFDGAKDRIIKTKNSLKEFETVFEALNIQDFQATKNELMSIFKRMDYLIFQDYVV